MTFFVICQVISKELKYTQVNSKIGFSASSSVLLRRGVCSVCAFAHQSEDFAAMGKQGFS